MTLAALVRALRARGIVLELRGDAVAIRPASSLTATERDTLQRHGAELVALLKSESAPAKPPKVTKPAAAPKTSAPLEPAPPAPTRSRPAVEAPVDARAARRSQRAVLRERKAFARFVAQVRANPPAGVLGREIPTPSRWPSPLDPNRRFR